MKRHPSDRTAEFDAYLKEAEKRTRQQKQQLDDGTIIDSSKAASTTSVSATAPLYVKTLTPFMQSAIHLRNSIRELRHLLSSHSAEYLNLHSLLSSDSSLRRSSASASSSNGVAVGALSDSDRDALESEVSLTSIELGKRIDQLKDSIPKRGEEKEEEIWDEEEDEMTEEEKQERRRKKEQDAASSSLATNPNLLAHQHTIIIILVEQLRSVVTLMSSLKQQRTQRMKDDLEVRFPGVLKKESERRKKEREEQEGKVKEKGKGGEEKKTLEEDTTNSSEPATLRNRSTKSSNGTKKTNSSTTAFHLDSVSSSPSSSFDPSSSTDPTLTFTATERAQLLEENHQLYDSLSSNLDQIKRAESRLLEISSLMSLFSEKVQEQEEQIHTIYDQAIQSTLHIHSGISQLKKAAERGVTFRMMILFMILMMSFSLLFLDWFMP